MSDDYPSRSLDRIMVRLPDGMRDRLAAAARQNKRSVNAEVVARLESTFYAERNTRVIDFGGPDIIPVDDLIEWLKERKTSKP